MLTRLLVVFSQKIHCFIHQFIVGFGLFSWIFGQMIPQSESRCVPCLGLWTDQYDVKCHAEEISMAKGMSPLPFPSNTSELASTKGVSGVRLVVLGSSKVRMWVMFGQGKKPLVLATSHNNQISFKNTNSVHYTESELGFKGQSCSFSATFCSVSWAEFT